jgi:hypothetical protein
VVVNLFPKFESPDDSSDTTTTTSDKPRWFVWRPANWKAGDAEVRMYFEVINEQSAEGKLLIPPQHQAEAQRVFGIPREIPLTAVRRGDAYVVNLKPLADKVSQYIRSNPKKASGEAGILSGFLGGGGGGSVDLRLDFPRVDVEVVPTTAGLRLRTIGNATLSADGASQNLPFDVTVVAKPAE